MNSSNEPIINVHISDLLDKLPQMPAELVQCIMTSPPYWGKRDYNIPPNIFGGRQKCKHRWNEHLKPAANGSTTPMAGETLSEHSATRKPQASHFCAKCGAWLGCHGLEPTIEMFVEHACHIFRLAKRVLRKDGVMWLNYGDTHLSDSGGYDGKRFAVSSKSQRAALPRFRRTTGATLKPKDLCGIPWRIATALQAGFAMCSACKSEKVTTAFPEWRGKRVCIGCLAKGKRHAVTETEKGWYLRSENIWAKDNPMPESAKDRPTVAHEQVFLFSREPDYYFDQEAVKEPVTGTSHARSAAAASFPSMADRNGEQGRRRENKPNGWHTAPNYHGANPQVRLPGVGPKSAPAGSGVKANTSFSHAVRSLVEKRNIRTVWRVNTFGYKGAHFATFPPDLVKICLMSGTSAKGACMHCGAPWTRVIESENRSNSGSGKSGKAIVGKGHPSDQIREGHDVRRGPTNATATLGWVPSCKCDGIDRRIIRSPLGRNHQGHEDPTLFSGRAGMERPENEEPGQRWITRHEQNEYAKQLKRSDHREAMTTEAGGSETFAHYTRTDMSGARPIPQKLMDEWTERGWLVPVIVPPLEDMPTRPCIAMDIFAGSGTVGAVAKELGLSAELIEIGSQYFPLIQQRIAETHHSLPGLIV